MAFNSAAEAEVGGYQLQKLFMEKGPSVSKSTPCLKPAEKILRLTAEDQCLDKLPKTVSLPPRSLEEACWLSYYVICQSTYAGTHILHHLLTSPPGKGFHLVPLMLYRHVLDLGDSIGTLFRFGSANSAAVLVRALFETSIGLEFLLQSNSFHEDRASCYEAFRMIKRLKNLIRYDPGTKEGAKLHAILDSDPKLKDVVFPRQDLSKDREEVETMLNEKRFRSHWEKYKNAKPTPKDWYGLCSTANDLRRLAREVGREAEYLLLYKMLSEVAHASDVMTGVVVIGEAKELSIHQLRGPVEKVKELVSLAANYLVWSHNHLLFTYLNGDEVHKRFTRWYIEDYREYFNWAISPGPLFVESDD